ncbi:hypothetical protein GCM10017752_59980 [Streptomyces roseoviridis]
MRGGIGDHLEPWSAPTATGRPGAVGATSGGYDRQLRRCQRAYRERRDALVAALERHFPGTEVSGIAAGLHVIARVPAEHGPTARFLERALAAGVALHPLEDYGTARPGDGAVRLVIGYAHLPPADIALGVRLVAEAEPQT